MNIGKRIHRFHLDEYRVLNSKIDTTCRVDDHAVVHDGQLNFRLNCGRGQCWFASGGIS